MDYAPIAAALNEIGYSGYASAEAFPYPDPTSAAKQTILQRRAKRFQTLVSYALPYRGLNSPKFGNFRIGFIGILPAAR